MVVAVRHTESGLGISIRLGAAVVELESACFIDRGAVEIRLDSTDQSDIFIPSPRLLSRCLRTRIRTQASSQPNPRIGVKYLPRPAR